jgi:hypothetical protein
MKHCTTQNIQRILRVIKARIIELLLFLTHKLLKSELHLIHLKQPDAFILQGNPFTISWKVVGCYKVTINNTIRIPGNQGVLLLDSKTAINSVFIAFHGINETIEKVLRLNIVSVNLNKKQRLIPEIEKLYFSTTVIQKPKVKLLNLYYKSHFIPIIPNLHPLKLLPHSISTKNIKPILMPLNETSQTNN